ARPISAPRRWAASSQSVRCLGDTNTGQGSKASQRNRWPLIRASALTLTPQFPVPSVQPQVQPAESQPQRPVAGRSDCRQLLLTRDETRQTRQEGVVAQGRIKRVVPDKGFGFIRDDRGQEFFFHRSSVEGDFTRLAEGQQVAFEEEPSPKGPRAGSVRPQ